MLGKTLANFDGHKKKLTHTAATVKNVLRRKWLLLPLMVVIAALIPVYFLLYSPYGGTQQQVGQQGEAAKPEAAAGQEAAMPGPPALKAGQPANSAMGNADTQQQQQAEQTKAAAETAPALTDMILPATGQMAEAYGFSYSPVFGDYRFHEGVDFSVQRDMPVSAVLSGTVSAVEYSSLYGYRVTVDHGGGWQTRYANLAQAGVEKGAAVAQGDNLGLIGDPGQAEAQTGTHLHLELLSDGDTVNPTAYLPIAK